MLQDVMLEDLMLQNAKQPILTLSVELLGLILSHLREIWPMGVRLGSPLFSTVIPRRLGWVVATHVCRRIRSIALLYSELWSTVDYRVLGERWARECFQRSRDAPINLDLTYQYRYELESHPGIHSFPNLLQNSRHASRIRTAKIGPSSLVLSFLTAIFPHPWSRIESLNINCYDISDRRMVLPLPLCSIGVTAPRLRCLVVQGLYIPWGSVPILSSTLTTLILSRSKPSEGPQALFIQTNDAIPPNLQDSCSALALSECLRSLPLLRSLGLSRMLYSTPSLPISPPILFPDLQNLTIDDAAKHCTWLLESLDTPRLETAGIGITSIDPSMHPEHLAYLRAISKFLASHFGLPNWSIHAVCVQISRSRFDFDAWTCNAESSPSGREPLEDDVLGKFGSGCLRLNIRFPPGVQSLPVVMKVLEQVSFAELDVFIAEIEVDTSESETALADFMDYDLCRSIYTPFSRAKTIRIYDAALVTLLPLMASQNVPNWQFPGFPQPRHPCFPRLEALTIFVGGDPNIAVETMDCCLASEPRLPGSPLQPLDLHLAFFHRCLASRAGYTPKLKFLQLMANRDAGSGYPRAANSFGDSEVWLRELEEAFAEVTEEFVYELWEDW